MTEQLDNTPAEIDPQDAFQLFSHELRLEILFALWEAPNYSLAFSDIQSAVGEQDSGKFTYHLEKLTDQFVAEVDGQYVLQYAGHRVIDAIQSGVFHTSPTVSTVEAPGDCPHCGATPTFTYNDHLATVSCQECGEKLVEYPLDPGAFQDRTIEEAVETFDRRTKFKWQLASSGVCFVCAGRVNVSYTESAAEMDHHDRYADFFASDHPLLFHLSCQNCSFYSYIPVGIRLLDSPAVLGRLASLDLNSVEGFLWELPFVVDPSCITIQDQNPWDVRINVPVAGEQISVTLGPNGTVQSLAITR